MLWFTPHLLKISDIVKNQLLEYNCQIWTKILVEALIEKGHLQSQAVELVQSAPKH